MAKPTVADQLRADITILTSARDALEDRVEKLTKELDQAKTVQEHYRKSNDAAERDIAAMHTILDMLPTPPPRKAPDAESWHSDLSIVARFAAWLGSR